MPLPSFFSLSFSFLVCRFPCNPLFLMQCACVFQILFSLHLCFITFLLPLHLCMCIFFPCLLFYSRFSFSRYLHATGHQYGRPIAGQKEISAHAYKSDNNLWKAMVIYSMYMFHWCHLANDKFIHVFTSLRRAVVLAGWVFAVVC